MPQGYHIIAEFRECNPKKLELVKTVKPILEASVKQSDLTKISSSYHQFKPFGVTGFILLAESHISIHTWPEKKYIAVDLFTCGPPRKALSVLIKGFNPKKIKKVEMKREWVIG